MSITIIGWMLVLGAAAIALRKGLRRSPREEGEAPAAPQTAELPYSPEEQRSWCAAVEELCDARAWLFDERLCLVAAGRRAEDERGAEAGPRHLIDVAPPEEAPLFLSGAASARRGEAASWECRWQGRRATVRAIPVAPDRILICIKDSTLIRQ